MKSDNLLLSAQTAAQQFMVEGELQHIVHVDTGHINHTFCSTWKVPGSPHGQSRGTVQAPASQSGAMRRYIHQRMNGNVFKDVPAVLQNVWHITDYLRARVTPPEQTLEFVPTRTGDRWLVADDGSLWRTSLFIEESEGFDVSPGHAHAEAVGAAFGRFLRLLSDFEQSSLVEPIKGFQDVESRYHAFDLAVREDPVGRAAEAREQIRFVQEHKGLAGVIAEGQASGKVPSRVTHADPKVNNVLFRRGTTDVLCVVDLDTCMVGTSLFDFGDMVRSAGVPVEEDEADLSKVKVDLTLFEALARGYLREAAEVLSAEEVALMAAVPGVIAFSLGMRFLADFILGDRYFRIHYPTHNLVRAKAQLQLARWVTENQGTLEGVLRACAPKNVFPVGSRVG